MAGSAPTNRHWDSASREVSQDLPARDLGSVSSNQFRQGPELGNGNGKALSLQGVEQLFGGATWVFQGCPLALYGPADAAPVERDEVGDEFVRVLSADIEWLQDLGREVLLVESHDDFRLGADGCGENVPVIGIG